VFDSKEIAQRALAMAEEIKAQRKRRKRFQTAAISFCMCAAASVFIFSLTIFPTIYTELPDEMFIFEDFEEQEIPLAGFVFLPDFNMPESMTVGSDASLIYMQFLNPAGNSCYFTFEVVLPGMDEPLYVSDMIEPSVYIESFTLPQPLEKGDHTAELIIRAYDSESFEEICSERAFYYLIVE
jgi:hypothetical protein